MTGGCFCVTYVTRLFRTLEDSFNIFSKYFPDNVILGRVSAFPDVTITVVKGYCRWLPGDLTVEEGASTTKFRGREVVEIEARWVVARRWRT